MRSEKCCVCLPDYGVCRINLMSQFYVYVCAKIELLTLARQNALYQGTHFVVVITPFGVLFAGLQGRRPEGA